MDGTPSSRVLPDLRRLRVILRGRIREGWRRVRAAIIPNLQTAVVATLAYVVSQVVLGHPVPIFAPIACYLAMGFTRNRQPRRVLEMGLGATVGVWMGELVAHAFGFGVIQVFLVIAVAPLVGRFVDKGDLLTYQSAMQSLTVVGWAAATGVVAPSAFGRWTDALVGTLLALLFTIVVPSRVSLIPRRLARNGLTELAHSLQTLASGFRGADDDLLQDAWTQLILVRELFGDGAAACTTASTAARYNPSLRADRTEVTELTRLFRLCQRLTGSVDMLARQGRGVVASGGALPQVADWVDEVARITWSLSGAVGNFVAPKRARTKALALASGLDPGTVEADTWRPVVMVSLLRAILVDILQLTGMSREQARLALPDTVPFDIDGSEGPSELWQDL